MTLEEFVKAEILVWGEDYIYDLMNRGYTPILTTVGWKWILDSDTQARNSLDTEPSSCYSS